MALQRHLFVAATALVSSLLASSPALAQAPDAGHEPAEWDHVFPLFGRKLATKGMKFPLPWGVGINYAYVDQPIDITRVAVGVNGGETVDITDVITFDKIQSKVQVANARLDLWVLPFLNVYGLANYVIESRTSITVSEPVQFNAGAIQGGVGGGFGATVAGGAFGFFGTLDLNFSWNKMDKLEQPVGTFLLTPRIGKNFGKVGPVELIVWVGAMRQEIQADTRGEIKLSEALGEKAGSVKEAIGVWYDGLGPVGKAAVDKVAPGIIDPNGDPTIQYHLDKSVASPWNMLVGTEVGLTDNWRLRAEVGFINRTQFLLGVNYRFAGP